MLNIINRSKKRFASEDGSAAVGKFFGYRFLCSRSDEQSGEASDVASSGDVATETKTYARDDMVLSEVKSMSQGSLGTTRVISCSTKERRDWEATLELCRRHRRMRMSTIISLERQSGDADLMCDWVNNDR